MKRITIVLVAIALALAATAPATAQNEDLLGEAIEATAWQTATFKHLFRLHGSDQEIVESGSVTFGELPQMRWQYRTPEEKLFVFDGRTSWLYVPSERQVSIHVLTESERSQLPFLMLGDAQRARRDFEIRSSRQRGLITVSLTPRTETSIRELTLSLDPRSKRIRAIEYLDVEENRTRFEFDSFRKAAREPGQFRFDPPPGVEPVEY